MQIFRVIAFFICIFVMIFDIIKAVYSIDEKEKLKYIIWTIVMVVCANINLAGFLINIKGV